MTHLSVVLPVYNEAANLMVLYKRLRQTLDSLQVSSEIIFVNDGSSDHSEQILAQLAATDPAVTDLHLSRNFGQQAALTCGIAAAKGEWIAMMDADLQDPPELLATLYRKAQEGFEVVYAMRKHRKGEAWLKRFTAAAFYRVLRMLTHTNIPLDTGEFRLIHRQVADQLLQMPERNRFLRGQIAWLGFRQTAVVFDRDSRHAGKSHYTWAKMLGLALDALTSFSVVPTRLVTFSGFFVFTVSLVLIAYTLYKKLFTTDYVTGWASLMVSILFVGGVQLISIGILGEYMLRINQNTNARPLYVVRKKKP